MRYDPTKHRATLQRLREVPDDRKLFFALWCQDPLWQRGGAALFSYLSKKSQAVVQDARKALWEQSLGGPKAKMGSQLAEALTEFQVEDDDYFGRVRCASALADLLEACAKQNDLSTTAISSGMILVAELDAYLQEIGVKDTLSTPLILEEVDRQFVMLDHLLESAPTTGLRGSSRPRDLFGEEEVDVVL